MNTLSDVEWEISQLVSAVEYYEKAILETSSIEDIERFKETIAHLNRQIMKLKGEK